MALPVDFDRRSNAVFCRHLTNGCSNGVQKVLVVRPLGKFSIRRVCVRRSRIGEFSKMRPEKSSASTSNISETDSTTCRFFRVGRSVATKGPKKPWQFERNASFRFLFIRDKPRNLRDAIAPKLETYEKCRRNLFCSSRTALSSCKISDFSDVPFSRYSPSKLDVSTKNRSVSPLG